MSFHKTWIITKSLLLSQLRATALSRGRAGVRSIIRRPLILVIIDVVGFVGAVVVTYYVGNLIVSSSPTTLLDYFSSAVKNVIVILPAVILTIILVLGLVLEVSAGAQFASSDTVNWLPVTASEYVAASTLSLLIYYSVFPIVVLGATLSLAIVFGGLSAWALAAVLSIFGVIASASILEILRAVLNRFSSSFYKKGGRTAQVLRALGGVIILVLFQAMFYPTVYEHFLGVITPTFGPTWLVPLLWASVAVTALFGANMFVVVVFSILAVAFGLVLFFFAVATRSKYWVPMQPSVRISSSAYTPKRGIASSFLSPAQLAITRKDLRGLVRRREMIRLLALPGIFIVVIFLSSASSGGLSFAGYLGMIIVAYSTMFFSMSSIGAEGKAIINLYQAPLSTRDFVVGKAVPPFVFGSLFGIAFYVVIGIALLRDFGATAPLFIVLSVGLAFEMSLVGQMFGLRFPNFSESPRASFVSQTGGLIAFPAAIIIGGLSLAPFLAASILNFGYVGVLEGFAASVVIIGVVSYIFYRLCFGQAAKLLAQVPLG
jgi:hypothetical protein